MKTRLSPCVPPTSSSITSTLFAVALSFLSLASASRACTNPPTIIHNPQSLSATAGSLVTFSVEATSDAGCPLTYQWFEYVGVDGDRVDIPGETNSTLTIVAEATNDPDENRFGCAVTNDAGSITTLLAYLYVTTRGGFFETNQIPIVSYSGDTFRLVTDSAASGGDTMMYDSNAIGDFLTFQLPRISAGTYSVRVGFKKHPSRGIVQTKIGKAGGTLGNLGSPIDLYSSASGYQEITVGTWTPTSSSDKQISFSVVGKNASSSGYSVNVDYVKLIQVMPSYDINFQPAGAPVPAGFLVDSGAVFGDRGNGLSYGWSSSNTANTRDRNVNSDQRVDTLIHTQNNGTFTWEMALPNGRYLVHLAAGDPSFTNSVYKFDVEGVRIIDDTPTAAEPLSEGTVSVLVTDGRLTVTNAPGSSNNKLCFINIQLENEAASVFADEFTGTSLSPTWNATAGISIQSGNAVSVQSSMMDKAVPLTSQSYILETRAKGFFTFTGSPSNSHQFVFGHNVDWQNVDHWYRVVAFEDGTFALQRDFTTIASTPLAFSSSAYVKWKIVRDGLSGLIQVWVDSGSGFGNVPKLQTYDSSHAPLGGLGWWRDSEAQNYNFSVDYVRVSQIVD